MPEVPPEYDYVWQGFALLTNYRPVGMGIAFIPLVEISTWMEFNNITEIEEKIEVSRLLCNMDKFYVDYLQEEQKNKSSEK